MNHLSDRGMQICGVAAVVAAGVALWSPLLMIAPPIVWAMAWHRASHANRRAGSRQLAAELPGFVDQVIHHLKSGRSLAEALRLDEAMVDGAGRNPLALDEVLGPARAALRAGLGLEASLARVGPDLPPGVDLLVTTLTVLVERGGPALPSLERLNDTLRSARWVELEAETQAGQATASALALAALPAVFAGGLAVLDRRLAHFYVLEPAGAVCLTAAAVLSYLGWWWMQLVIGSAR